MLVGCGGQGDSYVLSQGAESMPQEHSERLKRECSRNGLAALHCVAGAGAGCSTEQVWVLPRIVQVLGMVLPRQHSGVGAITLHPCGQGVTSLPMQLVDLQGQ